MPGHIYVADGPGPHPTVVLLHGIPGNEKNLDLAQSLRRNGFNVLFFHYRGAWGAEGAYKLSQLDDDALAVVAFLRDRASAEQYRVDPERLTLIGHSMGAFTALAAGRQDADLMCVGAMSPVNLGLLKTGLESGDATLAQGLADYADQLFMLADFDGEAMLADIDATGLAAWDITGFGPGLADKPLLMLVGDQDDVTPAAENLMPAVAAYREAGVDVALRIIDGDHGFSGNRLGLIRTVTRWALSRCR
jgi:hypothetical protein